MLAAGPEIDGVDRIAWRRRANVAQRYAHVSSARLLLDRVQNIEGQSFRRLDARPDRCPESQKKLGAGDSRKNLPSEIRTKKRHHHHGKDNISRDRETSDRR